MRKKPLFLLSIFLFVTFIENVNAQWERIEGLYGGMILGVTGDNPTMYAVSATRLLSKYYLYRSNDMGITWDNTYLDVTNYYDVAAKDSDIFVAFGYPTNNHTCLIHSSDYGRTWESINGIFDSVYVQSISIKDSMVIVTNPYAGLFFSKDNGANWSRSDINNLPEGRQIWDIAYSDSAIFLSAENCLYRSTDNCVSWDQIYEGIHVIYCIASNGTNLILNTGYDFYISSDDGDSWTKLSSPDLGSTGGANKLVYYGSHLYFTNISQLFHSADSGNNWTELKLGIDSSEIYRDIYIDSSGVYVATERGMIYSTIDGVNWSYMDLSGITSRSVEEFEFCGNSIFTFSVPPTPYLGNIYSMSTNSWKPIITDPELSLSTFASFGNNQIIAGCRNDTSVLCYNANEDIWNKVGNVKTSMIRSTGTELYAIIDSIPYYNNIYKSTDGGYTWDRLLIDDKFGKFTNIFIDDENIFVTKDIYDLPTLALFRSKDSGNTWEFITADTFQINAVFTIDSVMFMGTESSSYNLNGLLRSLDGGKTWDNIFPNKSISSALKRGHNLIFSSGNEVFRMDYLNRSILNISDSLMGNINQLKINDDYLYAGTIRGLWRRPLSDFIVGTHRDRFSTITDYALHRAYPNPFNPKTTFRFDLPEETHVEIVVYDLMGREVWKSAKTHYSAGTYSVVWNGVNQSGQPVGTGMYIVRLKSPRYSATQKVLLMK